MGSTEKPGLFHRDILDLIRPRKPKRPTISRQTTHPVEEVRRTIQSEITPHNCKRIYEGLPPDDKLKAVLGFEGKNASGRSVQAEACDLPPMMIHLCQVVVDKCNADATRAVLQPPLALSCASTFNGSPTDSKVALTFVVADKEKAPQAIGHALKTQQINAHLAVVEESCLMIKPGANPVIPTYRFPAETSALTAPLKTTSVSKGRMGESIYQPIKAPKADPIQFGIAGMSFGALDLARKESIERKEDVPPSTPCTYVIVDSRLFAAQTARDPEVKKFIGALDVLMRSPKFYTTSWQGNMVIMDVAPKATSTLAQIGKQLERDLESSRFRAFVMDGIVEQSVDGKSFGIKGFPTAREYTQMTNQITRPGVYLPDSFVKRFATGEGRETSLCRVETSPSQMAGWQKLDTVKALPRGCVDGPTKCIGLGKEVQQMTDFLLESPNAKVLLIKGRAASGKTKAWDAACEECPNAIRFTFTPSGIPRQGLFDLAIQMLDKIREAGIDRVFVERARSRGVDVSKISELYNFERMSLDDKFQYKDAKKLADAVVQALALFNEASGNPVSFDDVHYLDDDSAQWIAYVAGQYEASRGKVVFLNREEKRLPKAITDLLSKVRGVPPKKDKVVEVEINAINLSNPELAREYVANYPPFFSGQEKPIGDSLAACGQIAGNKPLVMNSLVKLLTKNAAQFVDISARNLELSDGGRRYIDGLKIKGLNGADDDLTIMQHEFLDNLSPSATQLLKCIALASRSMTVPEMVEVGKKVLSTDDEPTLRALIHELANNLTGFLVGEDTSAQEGKHADAVKYVFSHEAIREVVLNGMGSAEKGELLNVMYTEEVGNRTAVTVQLAKYAPPKPEDKFWGELECLADARFSEIAERRDAEQGYVYAATLCEVPELKFAFEALANQRGSVPNPHALHRLSAKYHLEKAQHALDTGRFDDLEPIATDMLTIGSNYSGLVDAKMVKQVKMLQFDAAYINNSQTDRERMRRIYDASLRDAAFSDDDRLDMYLKLSYRLNQLGSVREEFKKRQKELRVLDTGERSRTGAPSRKVTALTRLCGLRVPVQELEAARKAANPNLDEDARFNPALYGEPQVVGQLSSALAIAGGLRKNCQDFPNLLDRREYVALVEQTAGVKAMIGQFGQACEEMREAARVAEEWHLPDQAGWDYMEAGVIAMTDAALQARLSTIKDGAHVTPRPTLELKPLLRAADSFERGVQAIGCLPEDNELHLILAGEHGLAVGRAFEALSPKFGKPEVDGEQTELCRQVTSALENMTYICTRWRDRAYEDPEARYCIGAALGALIPAAERFGFEVPNEITQSSFMEPGVLAQAEKTVQGLTDGGMGEVQRKLTGVLAAQKYMRRLGLEGTRSA